MGTPIQEVYDAFFIKCPDEDFMGKESSVFQYFKAALAYCGKTVPESLTYAYDSILHEGYFDDILGQDSIELISLCMTRELYRTSFNKLRKVKQHIGTQAFNKLPDLSKQFGDAEDHMRDLNDEIYKFRQEFYTYEN